MQDIDLDMAQRGIMHACAFLIECTFLKFAWLCLWRELDMQAFIPPESWSWAEHHLRAGTVDPSSSLWPRGSECWTSAHTPEGLPWQQRLAERQKSQVKVSLLNVHSGFLADIHFLGDLQWWFQAPLV